MNSKLTAKFSIWHGSLRTSQILPFEYISSKSKAKLLWLFTIDNSQQNRESRVGADDGELKSFHYCSREFKALKEISACTKKITSRLETKRKRCGVGILKGVRKFPFSARGSLFFFTSSKWRRLHTLLSFLIYNDYH